MAWEPLAFAGLLSVCLGVSGGLIASVAASSRQSAFATPLRGHGPTRRSGGLHRVLIVAEIGLALMLSVAAGLLVQTMRQLNAVPLGFDPANVIAIAYSPRSAIGGTLDRVSLERKLIEGIRGIDGVVAAGVGSRPLDSAGMRTTFARPAAPSEAIEITVDPVGPGYLEALGARLVGGRFFTDRDGPDSAGVAMVNETAAAQYWPDGALGATVIQNKRPVVIVGILNDVRRTGLEVAPEPTLYTPSSQTAQFSNNNILVRTSGEPRALLPALRTVVRQATPGMPLTQIQTLQERLDIALAPRRFTLWLVGLFSILALSLAVMGIYGVITESVAQRVPEIGVRMALGASAASVLRMVLRQGAWLIVAGLALGTIAALAVNDVMAVFVFQVPTTDVISFVSGCAVLATTGLLASAVPAWRASRVDPVVALRE